MGSLERLDFAIIPKGLKYMVSAIGIESTRPQGTRDFESTNFWHVTQRLYYRIINNIKWLD